MHSAELFESRVGRFGPDRGLGGGLVRVDVAMEGGLGVPSKRGWRRALPGSALASSGKRPSMALGRKAEASVR